MIQGRGPSALMLAATCCLLLGALRFVACSDEGKGAPLPDGEIRFTGVPPGLTTATYTTKEGVALTVQFAVEGWVTLLVSPSADAAAVKGAIETKGGSIVDAIPKVGHYTVKIAQARVAAFLTNMYTEPFVISGEPTTPLVAAGTTVVDTGFATGSGSPLDCDKNHGECVAAVAARCSTPPCSPVKRISAEDYTRREWFSGFLSAAGLPHRLGRQVKEAMELAAAGNEPVVINLSMGSLACGKLDVYAGGPAWCREGEKNFLLGLAKVLEGVPQSVRDRAVLVVASGNLGIDLTEALQFVADKAPEGFSRMRVVGGTDELGSIDSIGGWNYADEHMIYAPARQVRITDSVKAIGTSYAAPEVSRVLNLMWEAAPSLSSDQLLAALDGALSEAGGEFGWGDPSLPPDLATGWTKQEFIELAVRKARLAAGLEDGGTSSPPDWQCPGSYGSSEGGAWSLQGSRPSYCSNDYCRRSCTYAHPSDASRQITFQGWWMPKSCSACQYELCGRLCASCQGSCERLSSTTLMAEIWWCSVPSAEQGASQARAFAQQRLGELEALALTCR